MPIIPSASDEEALRNAANEDAPNNNSRYSMSGSSTNISDYQSAYSQVIDSEGEQGSVAQQQENPDAQANTTQEPELSKVSSSASTIKNDTRKNEASASAAAATASSELEDQAHDDEYTDNLAEEYSEQSYAPLEQEQDQLNQASDPVELAKTITSMSIARSHRSFTDDKVYGEPVPATRDFSKTEGEEFEEALQRTISRKSLTKEKIIRDEKLEEERIQANKPEEIDPKTLDWDSPTDKDNPQNWSPVRKWIYTMITATICLEVTFGSSLYMCGVPDMVIKLGVSQELAISGLTFYLLGLAFGPALAAPISELFGRRVVYVSALPISMLFTMGVGLSKHIRSILVLRFFAGFFASPAMAVAGGTIADLWGFEMMGMAMSGFCLAPFAGPIMGPVIGGYAVEGTGKWQWSQWINLFLAGAICLPVYLTPETYKPVILRKRAIKRGIPLKKPDLSAWQFIKIMATVTLMTPVKMLFVEPIVMVFSIYIAFVFAVLFGFFEAYPIIFRGVYHMSLGNSGLAFLGIGLGLCLGALFYIYCDRYIFFKKNPDGTRGARNADGSYVIDPESRLLICKVGAICMPAALFWLGWSSRPSVHWICPIIAGIPFGFGLILIFFSTIIYFSMAYPPLSLASALAANNLFRYILASVFPLFTVQMYDRLHIDWASSLFAFISVAMIPIPWLLAKYGPKLRNKSTFGYAAMIKKQQIENARLEKLQEEAEQEILNNELGAEKNSETSSDNYNRV